MADRLSNYNLEMASDLNSGLAEMELDDDRERVS